MCVSWLWMFSVARLFRFTLDGPDGCKVQTRRPDEPSHINIDSAEKVRYSTHIHHLSNPTIIVLFSMFDASSFGFSRAHLNLDVLWSSSLKIVIVCGIGVYFRLYKYKYKYIVLCIYIYWQVEKIVPGEGWPTNNNAVDTQRGSSISSISIVNIRRFVYQSQSHFRQGCRV